ncbi:MAG TPA: phosphatase PAP2 family protein [Phnomibacter sp.]|nr:phosphatase PAP2 family protein [Phnomibacter sp.]
MLEKLKHIDIVWLHTVNQKWSNPFFDAVVPWLRYQQVWYPFYIFLIAFALYNFGKKGAWWIASFILTIGITDTTSSRLIKNSIQRLRPCNDPDVLPLIDLRVPHCSGGYSFTSSHAANHFGMAMFIYITLSPILGKRTAWIFLWPAVVSYAQVYVGVHYPFDVLVGAFLGMALGWCTGKYFNSKMPNLAA